MLNKLVDIVVSKDANNVKDLDKINALTVKKDLFYKMDFAKIIVIQDILKGMGCVFNAMKVVKNAMKN